MYVRQTHVTLPLCTHPCRATGGATAVRTWNRSPTDAAVQYTMRCASHSWPTRFKTCAGVIVD